MTRLLCILAVACGGAHPPPTTPLTVTDEREVLVPVVVDGHPFMFQLDTGASASAITPATRDRLGLPHGARAESIGAGGPLDAEEVVVHHVRVGDRELDELHVAVMGLESLPTKTLIDGVLGRDVLGQFVADIDLAKRRLVLHAPSSTGWRTPDLVEIPFTDDEGLIRVDARLGSIDVAAILDLGASATVANRLAGPGASDAVHGQAYGADGRPVEVRALGLTTVRVGDLAFVADSVVVADLPVFATLHVADRPAIILGMDLLGSHRLVIDSAAKRLYIARR
jgi:hypothetical protein